MAEVMLFHYRDRNTFLNKANPLTKIALTLLFSYALVHAGLLRIAIITVLLALVVAAIHLPIAQYKRELRFFLVMGIIIAVSQYFATRSILVAAIAVIRFLDIVIIGALFADTTAPDDLARSMGALLSRIPKVRGERIAATLELTLSTVPLLFDASAQVREARLARLESQWKHPVRRIVSYGSAVFTLLLERAEDLAAALEARAYDVDAKRDTLPLKVHDALVMAGALVLVLPTLLLSH